MHFIAYNSYEMIDSILLAYLAISVLLLAIALAVIINGYKSKERISFFFFALFVVAWIITNYFSNDFEISLSAARAANHLVLFFAGLAVLSLSQFIIQLVRPRFWYKHRWFVLLISLASIIPALTPSVVSSIAKEEQVYAIEFGPLASVYFFALLINVLLIIICLVNGIRHAEDQERKRVISITWSILIFLALTLFTNAVIPIFGGSFVLTNLGPLASSIVVIGIAYSIAKHRLFDIRLVVARSLGYALSILTLSTFYAIIAFSTINTIFFQSYTTSAISVGQEVAYTLMAVLLAFTFQPLKSFFDKLTNSIFYRDAYDSQELLDRLNKVLVGNIEIDKLLTKSAEVVGSELKTSFISFVIGRAGSDPGRMIGTSQGKNINQKDISDMEKKVLPNLRAKVVIVDELNESKDAEAQKKFRDMDIGAVVCLSDNSTRWQNRIGYVILGDKKSGNPYSSKDTKMLEIIADELVIAIQNALRFEEIQNFAETLQEKVDDATRKLRRTNEKLKQLDQTKDDFISMASHQLRTPLTSVKGYISMVIEGDAGKITSQQRKLLDQAFVSSQRMVYLIADLLNVSRLRTGKFIIEPKPTNLAEVVDGEISQLIETAKSRGLELTYDKPKSFPELMLDETKIRQVIMNFADNAIYYTPTGGHIKVGLAEKGESIEFTVVDDGIGVPKSEQHHLFNKFYRAGNAKKARPDGTGLGLFMAKKVVIAQGGAIIFHTEEGKGSTFGFSFSKAALSPAHFKKLPQAAVNVEIPKS